MTDKELLAKCLEFLEEGYGDLYKQLLVQQLREKLQEDIAEVKKRASP